MKVELTKLWEGRIVHNFGIISFKFNFCIEMEYGIQ